MIVEKIRENKMNTIQITDTVTDQSFTGDWEALEYWLEENFDTTQPQIADACYDLIHGFRMVENGRGFTEAAATALDSLALELE